MAIEVGPSRDLRSVQQSVEQSRQKRQKVEQVQGRDAQVSSPNMKIQGFRKDPSTLPGISGASSEFNVDTEDSLEKYGLSGVKAKAMARADAVTISSPTVRGGGWNHTVPEDVAALSSAGAPFPLHEDLDPKLDPFAMVEAASRLMADQIRSAPGLAVSVQANVSPGQAYRLLAD